MAPQRQWRVALLVFALAMGIEWRGAAAEARELALATVTLGELQAPTPSTTRTVASAVAQVGAFAVTLPGDGGDAVASALRSYAGCSGGGHPGAAELKQSVLDDGAARTSLALAPADDVPPALARSCPGFAAASPALRHLVAATGEAFAAVLDGLAFGQRGDAPRPMGPPEDDALTPVPDGFAAAVAHGQSLEHFHAYRRPGGEPASGSDGAAPANATLGMHVDLGLFLVMAPAALLAADSLAPAAAPAAAGLLLAMPGGEVVRPAAPAGALVVMMGSGARRWVGGLPAGLVLAAPPHEVVVPAGGGLVRSWYGRMFLPEARARLDGGNLTYGAYRAQTAAAFAAGTPGEASPAGCGPGEALGDEKTCAHGEIYCWMTCMSTAKLDCGAEEPVCSDTAGRRWPEEFEGPGGRPLHCFDCQASCPAAPRPPPEALSICNANLSATVMWMQGFQAMEVGAGQPCISLLFEWAVLDSRAAFAAGAAATFVGGVGVEYIVYARRRMLAHWHPPTTPATRARFYAVTVAVYALQVVLGYLLMLVAMTYQVELFVAVVAGLTAGHAIFNAKGPVLDSSDACCMGLDPWSPRPDDPPDALQRRLSVPEDDLAQLADPLLANGGGGGGGGEAADTAHTGSAARCC